MAVFVITNKQYLDVPTAVKAHMYSNMAEIVKRSQFQSDWLRDFGFALFYCLFYGIGVDRNYKEALGWLTKAAESGDLLAKSLVLSTYRYLSLEPPDDVPALIWCIQAVTMTGSSNALVTFYKAMKQPVDAFGLLGRFRSYIWDHRFKIHQTASQHGLNIDDADQLLDQLYNKLRVRAGNPSAMDELILLRPENHHLLHFIAMSGSMDCLLLVIYILLLNHVDINIQTSRGETALLFATRAGRFEMAEILLQFGAKASIKASNGESPLHWLISMHVTAEKLESLAVAMVKSGGDLNSFVDNPFGDTWHYANGWVSSYLEPQYYFTVRNTYMAYIY
jgi:hypothetical protein